VVVLNCKDLAGEVIDRLKNKAGMVVGAGYGKMKETQIRIANFPAVDLNQVQTLIDNLKK
jgi:phosphoserine aminotransferase